MSKQDALPKNMQEFLDFCIERQNVLERRAAGQEKPWSEWPELQQYFFCNVFREDDKTTIWFRENIREPLRNDPKVLIATVAFRFFNRITTGALIKDIILKEGWNRDKVVKILEIMPPPIFTGAYMIRSPHGMSKLEGIAQSIEKISKDSELLLSKVVPGETSLKGLWNVLRQYDCVGTFISYEIVTDLRHTFLLENAPDINTWCAPGPGCSRGLGRLVSDTIHKYSLTSQAQWGQMIPLMQQILEWVNKNWPEPWPRWEMRDVEHTLCEYDKYKRAKLDEGRLKRGYQGTKEVQGGRRGRARITGTPAERISGTIK